MGAFRGLVGWLGLAAASGACAPQSAEGGVNEARDAVAKGALLLDVRTPSEFGSGHIAGAVNIPLDALTVRAKEIAAGREVVVYCRSGRRSAAAAELLRARGHHVIDIGPMGAW